MAGTPRGLSEADAPATTPIDDSEGRARAPRVHLEHERAALLLLCDAVAKRRCGRTPRSPDLGCAASAADGLRIIIIDVQRGMTSAAH